MNEEQRLGKNGNTRDTAQDIKSSSGKKDYSKYFDFSSAKIEQKDDGRKVMKLGGRSILINEQPDYSKGKRRGKEDVQVHYDFSIPEEMKSIGKGKKFIVRTYGCP